MIFVSTVSSIFTPLILINGSLNLNISESIFTNVSSYSSNGTIFSNDGVADRDDLNISILIVDSKFHGM
jgi:hypothetical protein